MRNRNLIDCFIDHQNIFISGKIFVNGVFDVEFFEVVKLKKGELLYSESTSCLFSNEPIILFGDNQ